MMLKYMLLMTVFLFASVSHAQDVWKDADAEIAKNAKVEESAQVEQNTQSEENTQNEDNEPDLINNMEETVALWTVDDVQKAYDNGFGMNTKDFKGNTPLYYALSRNLSLDVVKKIIELGANVNEPAANGMLPINVPTSKANELQLQILMMKTMGLDMSNPKIESELEKNVFHEMSRMTEATAILIDAGADVNKESVLGTPLMNAATNKWNTEIINLLIKYHADVNKRDKNGRTALFYAFSSGNDDIVSLLIQAGANTEITDKDGRTYMELERTEIK